jgi:hypothetical protein
VWCRDGDEVGTLHLLKQAQHIQLAHSIPGSSKKGRGGAQIMASSRCNEKCVDAFMLWMIGLSSNKSGERGGKRGEGRRGEGMDGRDGALQTTAYYTSSTILQPQNFAAPDTPT